jgi:hypothetical protein
MPIVNRDTEEPVTALATGALPEPQLEQAPDTARSSARPFARTTSSVRTSATELRGINNEVDPNYSAWDEIKGTPYEEHWSAFAPSNNRRYTQSLKRQLDKEDQDKRTLAAGGWTSTLANLSATILDPTILIPVGGEVAKGVEGYRFCERQRGRRLLAALPRLRRKPDFSHSG